MTAFVMVTAAQVADVGAAAAVLYARMCWRAEGTGSWRASRAVLAEETGLTADTIKTAVRVLRDRGLVTSVRSSAEDATLVWIPLLAGQTEIGDIPSPPPRFAQTPPGELPISSLETVDTTTPPLTPPGGQEALPLLTVVRETAAVDDVSEEFPGFWALYPRHVGRAAAERAYRTARKSATLAAIRDGLRGQLPDLSSRPMDKRPHASTWLNQRRWEDDPAHAAQPARSSGPRNALLDPNLMAGFPALGGGR